MAKKNITSQARPSAVRSAAAEVKEVSNPDSFVFSKTTFLWIGGGIAMMLIGMLLMAGGGMPSPDVWDEDIIYSFRRITLAPIVILAGLGVITYAILKK